MARGNNKPGRKLIQSLPAATPAEAPDEYVVQFKPDHAEQGFDLDSKFVPKTHIPGNSVGFSKFESEIVKQSYESGGIFDEKGNMIISKTQKSVDSVSWTVDDILESQKNGPMKAILTHNHPGGGSFSVADFVALAQSKLLEERAVGRHYAYSLKGNADFYKKYDIDIRTGYRGNNMFSNKAARAIKGTIKRLEKDINDAVKKGYVDFQYGDYVHNFERQESRAMTQQEKMEAYTHIRNTVIAKKLGLTYTRTPVKIPV